MNIRTVSAVLASAATILGSSWAQNFEVEAFDALRANAGVDVTVIVGSERSVRLVSDTDPAEASVSVNGGTLLLSRERQGRLNIGFGRDAQIAYEVTMPALTAAEAASGADVTITGIDASSLELKASSGSDLTASGTCERLAVESSSGSDVHAFGLGCRDVRARSSSGGEIRVEATSSIEAAASSGSGVWVRGGPADRSIRETSGGEVVIRG
ncbi:MAG: DUF2807 domain-containing protein [Pseudomonadota bacterium]